MTGGLLGYMLGGVSSWPIWLLSAFGLGRQYAPFGFSLIALHLDHSDTPLRLRQNMEF